MRMTLWLIAYGWVIVTGSMHFMVDVVSQYVRGVRSPGTESTYYYGMNTAFALGEVLFGLFGLILCLKAPQLAAEWPAVTLAIAAALAWLAFSFMFLPYREPKIISFIFALLVIAAAVKSLAL
ncbi:hypothetical protein [Paenibacillus wynnii]|uniref:Membrane protein n=1 Tax=Paenibacillus wynnii TaxID=268407 RepID=A0A098M508_9BACL|nr:hypothetical protein [Paenibacillus wynnii]KGE17644.1 membrane protein [Paenibacillus wynnii]